MSDRSEAPALAWASTRGFAIRALSARDFKDRAAFDMALADAIADFAPGLVVLAGFMRILGAAVVERFAGRILNIHPSLLPRYPGLHTHRRVLEAGDPEHGASVHFVTAELDGGPVVLQARVPVLPGDDELTLAGRVLVQEHRIYPLAIRWFAEGRLRLEDGAVWFDGQPLDAPLVIDGRADAV
jgi:phosphoribosylglycinamide formyltransferase-1